MQKADQMRHPDRYFLSPTLSA